MAPLLDIFITLLHLGKTGWKQHLKTRKELVPYFRQKMEEVATKHGERVLDTPQNTISFGLTVSNVTKAARKDPTYLGSMIFKRGVSGARIVSQGASKTIGPFTFTGYGAHTDAYPEMYLTTACSIGLDKRVRLQSLLTLFSTKL